MPFVDTVEPRPRVPLAPLTTLKVGGVAEWFVRATSAGQVEASHRWAAGRGLPVFVLGGGSNIVVADDGVPGLTLQIAIAGAEFRAGADDALIDAGAGELWDALVARAVAAGYAGIETLSGIPGCVGGTPIQNVGAYGQEVGHTIENVEVFDAHAGALTSIPARECGFAYRHSRFKGADAGRFTICRVAFRLRRGAPTVTYPDVVAWVAQHAPAGASVADVRRGVIEIRRRKAMVLDPTDPDTRSVGSFFTNPVVPASTQSALGSPGFASADGRVKIPAAWLIERAGFTRGFEAGAVGISSKHPLAIVARDGATADEVVELACRVKRAVFDRTGVVLRPEPVFVGFGADARIDFLQRDSL